MPETITLGHFLMLLGLIAGLYALWQASISLKHRGYGPGTPQYARAPRRPAAISSGASLVALPLFAIGCLTPLCDMAIA